MYVIELIPMDNSTFKKGLRIQLDHKLNIILKGDATANKTNALLDAYVSITSSFFSMLYWSDHIKNISGTIFQEFIDRLKCVQRTGTKMIKGLKGSTQEEHLKSLSIFSMVKRRQMLFSSISVPSPMGKGAEWF